MRKQISVFTSPFIVEMFPQTDKALNVAGNVSENG